MIETDEVGKKNIISELENEVYCMMKLIIEDREGKREKRRRSKKEENEKKVEKMVLVVGNDENKEVPEEGNGDEVNAESENKVVGELNVHQEMKKSNDKENSTAIGKTIDETVNRTIGKVNKYLIIRDCSLS